MHTLARLARCVEAIRNRLSETAPVRDRLRAAGLASPAATPVHMGTGQTATRRLPMTVDNLQPDKDGEPSATRKCAIVCDVTLVRRSGGEVACETRRPARPVDAAGTAHRIRHRRRQPPLARRRGLCACSPSSWPAPSPSSAAIAPGRPIPASAAQNRTSITSAS